MAMQILIPLIHYAAVAVQAIVIAGVALSWLHLMGRPPRWVYSRWALWIDDAYRALLRPFRNLLYRWRVNTGPVDISPMLAILAVWVVRDLLIRVLAGLG